MVKLYTNRELSEKLGINLAKWKRWSREFLPPDPLGGMQSGFARQYYFGDAFHVMFGGHLVGDLHFNVHEARRILSDLQEWLTESGYYQDPSERTAGKTPGPCIEKTKIFIHMYATGKKQIEFAYSIRGILSNEAVVVNGVKAREERYVETVIGPEENTLKEDEIHRESILNISSLYTNFTGKLGH